MCTDSGQWEPYQVPTANWTRLPLAPFHHAVMDLHGRPKAFRESIPVDINLCEGSEHAYSYLV